MRLWHKEFIQALPREQLLAQWRELSAIAGAVIKNGTPNHLLVNFVLDYDWNHFISYSYYVRQEMTRRGYITMDKVWNKICSVAENEYKLLPFEEIYQEKMNKEYCEICYNNLLEKNLCGGIDYEDWLNIRNAYWAYMHKGV